MVNDCSESYIHFQYLSTYHRIVLIKMKCKKHHSVGTIPITNGKNESVKIDTSSTEIHDRLRSWLGLCTSVKGGWVKRVLWAQTSPLFE